MAKKIIQVNKNPVYEIGMVATVFGKDTEFFGDLTFDKSLQINGYFEGEIKNGDFLVIGEKAEVRANIQVKTAIIKGTVHGNVEATDKLEIQKEGKLYGNIRTSKLIIADGVVFEGKCEMIKPEHGSKKKEQATEEPASA